MSVAPSAPLPAPAPVPGPSDGVSEVEIAAMLRAAALESRRAFRTPGSERLTAALGAIVLVLAAWNVHLLVGWRHG